MIVSPGPVRPEEIANATVFFASEQAGWITGQ